MKIRLGVLFGGKSVEHEISVISAIQAIDNLDKDKYEIHPIYITKENHMYYGENIQDMDAYKDIPALLKESHQITLVKEGNKVAIVKYPFKLFPKTFGYIDVLFPIVHGTNTEDGTLQGYLKMLNIPFVGPDVLASSVGMDKYIMKALFRENSIPVLSCKSYMNMEFIQSNDAMISDIEKNFSYPVIVKPVNLGSSIGISAANDKEALGDALETAFTYSEQIIVEPMIKHLKEINCAVVGSANHAEASECEEPLNAEEILTYENKYIGGSKAKQGGSKGMATLSRQIPARISGEDRDYIRNLAIKAFKVLGCNGVSRIDFMIDMDTHNIYLNEINTIPGSLAFYLWEPLGISYTELLDRMIQLALERKREQDEIVYSFDTNVLAGINLQGNKGSKG